MKTSNLLIIVMGFLAGCANPDNLIFRDRAGNIVATGTLSLPNPLPAVGQSFDGRWELRWSTNSFPADSTKSGKYSGEVQETGVSIDLNPGVADSNVLLNGSVINGSLSGRWSHSTIAGGEDLGAFTVTRPTGR